MFWSKIFYLFSVFAMLMNLGIRLSSKEIKITLFIVCGHFKDKRFELKNQREVLKKRESYAPNVEHVLFLQQCCISIFFSMFD